MNATCSNCKWMRENGPHLGCYYQESWHAWLNKKDAKVVRQCERDRYNQLRFSYTGHSPLQDCYWGAE